MTKQVCCQSQEGNSNTYVWLLTLHVLFNWKTPHNIPVTISNEALKAADSFVTISVQHASYLAGRGEPSEAIENVNLLQQGTLIMLVFISVEYNTPSYVTKGIPYT